MWHDFPGEQFERRYDVALSEIAEETGNEHKVATAELVLQFSDARGDGVRAADNCDLAEPARRDLSPIATLSHSGGQVIRRAHEGYGESEGCLAFSIQTNLMLSRGVRAARGTG